MKTTRKPKSIDPKRLLPRITIELVEGQEILKEKKKKLKQAKDPVRKDNLKRETKVIEKAVRGLEAHRQILKESPAK